MFFIYYPYFICTVENSNSVEATPRLRLRTSLCTGTLSAFLLVFVFQQCGVPALLE
jgi:hypothetical protein